MAAKRRTGAKDANVIMLASSSRSMDELVKEIKKINTKTDVIQVFDPASVINTIHLCGAYFNAADAFKNGTNVSKSMGMEMLLFAAMTSQISDAIAKVGAKSNKKMVVFANTPKAFAKARPLFIKVSKFSRPPAGQLKIARKYGLTRGTELDHELLQKMTLSRIDS